MTTFDNREQAYEKKFALDSELRFKAEAMRNKALAEWAGLKMGLSKPDLDIYIKEVRKADLQEKGDEDVFQKVKSDLSLKGLKISDSEIRNIMNEFMAKALQDLQK